MRTTPWHHAAAVATLLCTLPVVVRAGSDGATVGVGSLQWLEYGEALARGKAENKHVLIDFYTSWCGWCKVMDRKTYGDSSVAVYLQNHFVLTKINAESPKPLKVGDTTKSGVEIAREYGVQSFPITWFVKPDGGRIDRLMGYVPPEKFQRALQFVHERQYEKKAQ